MEYNIVKNKIISYIDAAFQWHKEGEGSIDEGVGQQMVDLEEEIITYFGLPFMAQQYSDIMQAEGFSNKDKEKRADELIEVLKIEAESYLLAPIEKDTEILSNGRNKLQDACEVLPLIGISTSGYNSFLYYDIFLRGIYNEKEMLSILKKVEAIESSSDSQIPYTYEELIKGDIFERLNKMNLPFLNGYKEFLNYKKTKHYWDSFTDNYDLEKYVELPYIFKLNYFIISHIHLKNEDTCTITILRPIGEKTLVELSIWCSANMMRIIMLHAKYYSIAIPPLYISSPRFLDEGVVDINISEAIGKNIEIENIEIELERLSDEDDEDQDPFSYIITDIKVKDNLPSIDLTYIKNDDLPF